MTETCPAELVGFAESLAGLAGDIHRRHFRRAVAAETKGDGTWVTEVDRAVEEAVREAIARRYPGHGVIGEEFAPDRPEAEFVWIVDPLDGTREFLHGLPLFCFLLALAWRGRFVLGLAAQAVAGDTWLGADGHGTTWNRQAVRTRPCARLSEATVSTLGYDSFCRRHAAVLTEVRNSCADRVTGDSSYAFGLLSMGRLDAIASAGYALHDYAALDPIVRNAGGLLCDWQGRPLGFGSGDTVLAVGDPRLRAPLLDLLRPAVAA